MEENEKKFMAPDALLTPQEAVADGLLTRCQVLLEERLAEQGEHADMRIVQLQHDCVQWLERNRKGKMEGVR